MVDGTAREKARTTFDHPLVVEAGAGTGKTTTLIARVTTWCVGPGWDLAATEGGDPSAIAARVLDGVVAITFTEAAAAEMAGRMGEALLAISTGQPVKGIPSLPVAPEVAESRARLLMGSVDRLTVSTIHAWCRRLLSLAPTQAGLHPSYQVDADGSLLGEVVHEEVVDWFTEVFAAQDPIIEDLLVLAEHKQGTESIAQAAALVASNAVPTSILAHTAFTPETIAALTRWLRAGFRDLATLLADSLVEEQNLAKAHAVRAGLQALRTRAAAVTDIAALGALADAAREFDDARLVDFARGSFTQTEARCMVNTDEARRAAKKAVFALAHLRQIDPRITESARRVIYALADRVNARLKQRGIVSFEQLLRAARDLLANFPEVRLRVRDGIRQLLVDEFQDTDAIQCDLVRMIALEGERRPGLFVVGDPKQSIYGWRKADLLAYQGFLDEVTLAGGEVVQLTVNRRSLKPVLDEVDRVIGPVMVPERGFQPNFERLVPHRDGEPPPPEPWRSVEYWVSRSADGAKRLTADTSRLEADALALDLLRLRRTGLAWDRVGILLRSTGDLDKYLEALRVSGIPYVVERDRQYFRRRDIIDAVALVRCILEPADALALLTVLRSPLVGVPDAALIPLWAGQLPRLMAGIDRPGVLDRVRELATEAAGRARASGAPGIERVTGWEHVLVDVAACIGWLRAHYDTLPADTFVERLRTLLPLEAIGAGRHLGPYRLANLQRFFTELTEALMRSDGDPHAVLRALRTGIAGRKEAEEARPARTDDGAVRVMTIHKAKGLDFDHVYLVQLHKGREEGVGKKTYDTFKAVQRDEAWHYELFGTRTPGYHAVIHHEEKVERSERIRLLYVAMTRARDRLVLMGNPGGGAPRPPLEAAKLMDLLAHRVGGVPDLSALVNGAIEHDGARWTLADLSAEETLTIEARAPEGDFEGEDDLPERRRRAAGRQARPVNAPASDAAHRTMAREGERPADEVAVDGESRASTPGTSAAAAIGTAVHAALETMDPRAPKERAAKEASARIEAVVRELVDEDQQADAVVAATRIVRDFLNGPLGARFRVIGPHILGREVPTLAAPDPGEDEGPVGFYAGAIDLLYRDPDTGDVVVADWKTDGVPTDEALAARVAAYTLQLAHYQRVVGQALEGRVRGELWFLRRGMIVVV